MRVRARTIGLVYPGWIMTARTHHLYCTLEQAHLQDGEITLFRVVRGRQMCHNSVEAHVLERRNGIEKSRQFIMGHAQPSHSRLDLNVVVSNGTRLTCCAVEPLKKIQSKDRRR